MFGSTRRVSLLREQALQVALGSRPPCPREIEERVASETKTPAAMRRAKATADILRNVQALIDDGELIVGQQPCYGAPGLAALAEKGVHVPKLGYLVPDFPKVLTRGLDAIGREARERLASCDEPERKEFYEAVIVVLDAAVAHAERYADAAEGLAGW